MLKVKTIICSVSIFFLVGCSFKPLTNRDIAIQAGLTLLTVADCMQTHDFKRKGLIEQNTMLGDHPSDTKIDLFCTGAIVAQWVGLWAMPEKARPYYQGAIGIGEAWAVRHNHRDGARIK